MKTFNKERCTSPINLTQEPYNACTILLKYDQ